MTEVLANILTSFTKDGEEHYMEFFGMYYGGDEPYWELTRFGKKLKVIPSPDHILEDGLWQMLDFLGMDKERLETLPDDLDPINMPEDYGWEYCAGKREGLESFLQGLTLNLTLVTYPGMDLEQAGRLTGRLQAAGIKIVYFGLSEKFRGDLIKTI